jgi:hypothetical protein
MIVQPGGLFQVPEEVNVCTFGRLILMSHHHAITMQ